MCWNAKVCSRGNVYAVAAGRRSSQPLDDIKSPFTDFFSALCSTSFLLLFASLPANMMHFAKLVILATALAGYSAKAYPVKLASLDEQLAIWTQPGTQTVDALLAKIKQHSVGASNLNARPC